MNRYHAAQYILSAAQIHRQTENWLHQADAELEDTQFYFTTDDFHLLMGVRTIEDALEFIENNIAKARATTGGAQ